jgi:hypothetical protein
MGPNVIDLARESQSANVALKQLKDQIRLGIGIEVNLGGVVIVSNPLSAPIKPSDSSDKVVACATNLRENSLEKMIAEIASLLPVIIEVASDA